MSRHNLCNHQLQQENTRRNYKWQDLSYRWILDGKSWCFTCEYLWWALRSSQSGHAHFCSHLNARSNLRGLRLIVSIWILLSLRRVVPPIVHITPLQAWISFTFRRDRALRKHLASSICFLTLHDCWRVKGNIVVYDRSTSEAVSSRIA